MLQSQLLDELHLYLATKRRFEKDVNILSLSGSWPAEVGLSNPSSLLPGKRAILMRIDKDGRNIDAALTSSPNILVAGTDSSFISTGQGNYIND